MSPIHTQIYFQSAKYDKKCSRSNKNCVFINILWANKYVAVTIINVIFLFVDLKKPFCLANNRNR